MSYAVHHVRKAEKLASLYLEAPRQPKREENGKRTFFLPSADNRLDQLFWQRR